MDARDIRLGDIVCDPSNYNYELVVGFSELKCAYLFIPVLLNESHLRKFSRSSLNGNEVYYREEGRNIVSIENLGGEWRVSIHSEQFSVEGKIHYVHELQHLLNDTYIHWRLCD